jgi:type II secretory pathway component PulJ
MTDVAGRLRGGPGRYGPMPGSRLRRRRAFTTLELMMSLAATFVLMVSAVAWVSTVMRSTTTAIELSASSRDREIVVNTLRDDLFQATSCDTSGIANLWVHVRDISVAFYADVVDTSGIAGPDGYVDAVHWRFSNDRLERGVAPGDEGVCPSINTAVYTTAADSVALPDSDVVFIGLVGGEEAPYLADCDSAASRCRYDGLRLTLTVLQPTPVESPVSIDKVFSVSTDTIRT